MSPSVYIARLFQRSGNSLPITLDLERPAAAFAFQIAEITARAGVQARGASEHEDGSPKNVKNGPDRAAVWKRLARCSLPAGCSGVGLVEIYNVH